MRKAVGVLLVIGGAALALLLKEKRRIPAVQHRTIVLGEENGVCGVAECPPPVTLSLRKKDKVTWHISNPAQPGSPCNHRVKVCFDHWQRKEQPVNAPIKDLDNRRFCREVHPGQTIPVPTQVRLTPLGTYTFKLVVDGRVSDDPMVDIVL